MVSVKRQQCIESVSRWPNSEDRARLDLEQDPLQLGASVAGVVHLAGGEPRDTMRCQLSCVQLIHENDIDSGTFVKVLWEASDEAIEIGAGGREVRFRFDIPPTCPPTDVSRPDRVLWVLEVSDLVERDWAWQDREYAVPPRDRRRWIVAQFELPVVGAEQATSRHRVSLAELVDDLQRGKPKGAQVTVGRGGAEVAVSIWRPQIMGGLAALAFAISGAALTIYVSRGVLDGATIAFDIVWLGVLLPIMLGAWFERVRVVFAADGLRLERRVILARRLAISYGEIAEADYEVTTMNGFRAYVHRQSAEREKFLVARNQSEAMVRWLVLGIRKAAGLPPHLSPQS